MHLVKFKFPDTEKVGIAEVEHEQSFSFKEPIVVETERGKELVKVIQSVFVDDDLGLKLKKRASKFLRRATAEDIKNFKENEEFARDSLPVCREKIKKHGLPMKLVKAYTTLERERLVFHFTAEGRVDFRQLVRDLAAHFKRRIELRQIGVRDEVKMLGAVGVCGSECCCKKFLECFDSISLSLAYFQGLPANPSKLSGICGRLMCCLKFEEGLYRIKEHLPKPGQTVMTERGEGKLIDVNIPLEIAVVELEGGAKAFLSIRELVSEEVYQDYLKSLSEAVQDNLKCFLREEDEIEEDFAEQTQ